MRKLDKQQKKANAKKEKAERERQKKEKARLAQALKDDKKAKRQAQVDATKILAKVTPAMLQLQTDLEHKMIKEVPKVVKQSATTCKRLLEKYHDEAQGAIKSPEPAPLSFSVDTACTAAREAQDIHGKLYNILSSMANAMHQ